MTVALAMVLVGPQLASPRLRTLLPNGAAILVEKMDTKSVSVQLFAASRGTEETAEHHGWRHLIEHLVLKGRDPKSPIDVRSESKGIFVMGRTYREATQFEVTCNSAQVDEALALLKEIISPLETTPEQIKAEVAIMKEEIALQDDAGRLGSAAWEAAYGSYGLDPVGDPEVMAKATPEGLAEIQAKEFSPGNLVISVSGPVDLKETTELCRQFLLETKGATPEAAARPTGEGGRIAVDGAFGEGRAVPVGSMRDPDTLACLAGALGVAAQVPGAFVTYTPSADPGLVIVGQTESTSGVGLFIDELDEGSLGRVFTIGKLFARRWLDRYLSTATGNGYVRGFILLKDQGARVEDIQASLRDLSFDRFKKVFVKFHQDKAIIVVGAAR